MEGIHGGRAGVDGSPASSVPGITLSFLDERDDSPRRSRPRRPPPRGPAGDNQTLLVRRLVALVAFVLFLVLMALLVKGCLNARKERAYEDYAREVTALVTESDQQSESLFELLGGSDGQSPVDVQNNVNGFRVEAQQLVDRAHAADPPDEFAAAQDYLLETLEFRSDGLAAVADRLPTALGEEDREEAVTGIAAQMQNFLASDVIYSQRAVPNLEGPLRQEELLNEAGDIPKSQFLPDIAWLEPQTVETRVAALRGEGGASSEEPATPGLHSTGLGDVTVLPGGEALVEGTSTQIPYSRDLAFEVGVVNQGENDETAVPVRVSISGGEEPIELEGELDSIAEGETGSVTIPLTDRPPTDQELEVTVTVEGVPGEEKLDNNEATFAVTFTS